MKCSLCGLILVLWSVQTGSALAQGSRACATPLRNVNIDTLRQFGPADPSGDAPAASAVAASDLNFDFSLNPYSLVDASVRFSDDGLKQKLSLTPLRLRARPRQWDAWTIGATNSGGGSTFSTGIGYDWSASYAPRARRVIEEFNCAQIPVDPPPVGDETPTDYGRRLEKLHLGQYREFWEGRFRNTVAVSATGSLQTFSSLSASKVDLDGDSVIDNEHQVRSRGVSGQVLFRRSVATTVAVAAQVGERRTSAIATSAMHPYRGASLTATHRVLELNPDYQSTPEYRSRQYVPSITAGISLEWLECRAKSDDCDNRVTEQRVLTPFVDVRLPGGTQFRLGLPVRRDRTGDTAGTRIVPVAQIGFSMANL
jgi:hypothetical protein